VLAFVRGSPGQGFYAWLVDAALCEAQKRSAIIFALGIFLYAYPALDPHTMRIRRAATDRRGVPDLVGDCALLRPKSAVGDRGGAVARILGADGALSGSCIRSRRAHDGWWQPSF